MSELVVNPVLDFTHGKVTVTVERNHVYTLVSNSCTRPESESVREGFVRELDECRQRIEAVKAVAAYLGIEGI